MPGVRRQDMPQAEQLLTSPSAERSQSSLLPKLLGSCSSGHHCASLLLLGLLGFGLGYAGLVAQPTLAVGVRLGMRASRLASPKLPPFDDVGASFRTRRLVGPALAQATRASSTHDIAQQRASRAGQLPIFFSLPPMQKFAGRSAAALDPSAASVGPWSIGEGAVATRQACRACSFPDFRLGTRGALGVRLPRERRRRLAGTRATATGVVSEPFKSPAQRLRELMTTTGTEVLLMPCCGDPLTAKLVLEGGFNITFLSGFSLSAYRGHPDAGLMSYGEVVDQARQVSEVLRDRIPFICDIDTGYGNPLNVRRTIRGLIRAGAAGVLLEDQVNPKKCGHTRGKRVVDWPEAEARLRAAVDARNEMRAEGSGDLFIIARTDARETHSLDEAIRRCQKFMEMGADMTFLEAPRDQAEMRRYTSEVPGLKLANMLEGGLTPILPPKELEEIGYKIAAYPLSLLSAGIKAQQEVLRRLAAGDVPGVDEMILPFAETRRVVGFDDYYKEEDNYKY